MVKVKRQREIVKWMMERFGVSERRACAVLGVHRSAIRKKPIKAPQDFLRSQIRDIAASRVRFGYRRIHVLLQREGWVVNHKRVYRLYKEEGLHLTRPSRHQRKSLARIPDKAVAMHPNECWSMDFVSDQLYNGKRFRALTMLDVYTRECLAIYVDKGIKGEQVAAVLEGITAQRGVPGRIKVDNGPEFISRSLDAWAYFNKVKLDYSRPGTPTDNAHIESFNGSFRSECLDTHWFMCLEDARDKIEAWRKDYNDFRPHSALTYQTPSEFARNHAISSGQTA